MTEIDALSVKIGVASLFLRLFCVSERRTSGQISAIFVFRFLGVFAHESSIKGAIIVRGGVLEFTSVADNDTTLHDAQCTYIHSCLQFTGLDQV